MSARSRQMLVIAPLVALVVAVLAHHPFAQSAERTTAEGRLNPMPYAKVTSEPIGEMSGIIKSHRRDNTYWVHNDSGDSARIFAITEDGKSILPTYSKFTSYGDAPEDGKTQWQGFEVLNAKNIDWEDIAVDDNYLYLADTGNNSNQRRDLGIYLISEIDPTASTRSAVVQYLQVAYPDQKEFPARERHFDSESLFTFNGALYLITKHRQNTGFNEFEQGADLYRLDTRYTDKPNPLTKIDSNAFIFAATGADVSPDGQTLAIVAMNGLWLFSRPADGDKWLSQPGRFWPFERGTFLQAEAITWIDNATLLIGNEQRLLFKLAVADLPPPTTPALTQ